VDGQPAAASRGQGSRGGRLPWRLVQALDRELAVDEDFGPQTERATRDFQAAHQLDVDGIVGRNTRAAMVRALGL
jgi:peptidoglycan hydrolase-like protein with peptidoglycan-binding domain